MSRYRIVQKEAYNGCIPIIAYFVQVRKEGLFFERWENIKGFSSYNRALSLYKMLNTII